DRRSVLFPEPDAPRSTTHSPAMTSRLILLSTGSTMPPCSWRVKDLLRSRTRIIAMLRRSYLQDRGDEQLRVGVWRVVEDLICQAVLDDLAALHHQEAMR